MNDFDERCFALALAAARRSLSAGDYPVGAVLAFDTHIAGTSNNIGESSKSYINHAETKLLIDNGKQLLHAATNRQTITLYSTLEPCLMCLGMATLNKVTRILYIQGDPHAGACGVDRTSLGARYQAAWPEIIHTAHTTESKELIVQYLSQQIANNIRVGWSKSFLKLLRPAA